MNKKRRTVFGVVSVAAVLIFGGWWVLGHIDKKTIALNSLSVFESVFQLLPVSADTKKAVEAANTLSHELLKKDGVTRTYLVLLQNNYELRPGGGFLGQYAVAKVLDGELTYLKLEDANLLDQRITAKVTPPYPFTRMMQIKKWKFRDSNFSPDFPTNAEKAQYFYRLSGGWEKFDGTIAINADVLNKVLAISGPITVYGRTFTSENGALILEEAVERAYLGDDVPAESKEHRKDIMKKLAAELAEKVVTVANIPNLVDFAREQLENKNIMLHFTDENLQKLVEEVHWGGKVAQGWDGDYLAVVDANMGALKTDYYMRRKMDYAVDITGERPTATLTLTYTNTATYGDWRTSDHHSYLRVFVPQGSELLDRKMVSYPNIQEEFGKTSFGFIMHTLINRTTTAVITYALPDRFKDASQAYHLLVQKQSGVGEVPFSVTLKTPDGEYRQEGVLTKDLKYTAEESEK